MSAIAVEQYREAMRENICGICVSFTRNPTNSTRCVYEDSGQCSLFTHVDEVVETVSSVNSGSIEPYLTALRQRGCAHCDHQDKRGVCDLRDNKGPAPGWCALDAYFNLIVGTIEDLRRGEAT